MPREFIQVTTKLPQFLPAYGLLLTDDFSNGVQFDATGDGTDFRTELSNAIVLTPPASLYLRTRVAGAADADEVIITRPFPRLGSAHISLYVTILSPDASDINNIELRTYITKANAIHYGAIRLDLINSRITYRYNNSQWGVVTGSDWLLTDSQWQLIEFKIDPHKLLYDSVAVGDTLYDMSTIDLNDYATPGRHENTVAITLTANGATSPELYFDSIALIQH